MSQQLISRSADLKRLRDEGYDIQVRDGALIVRDVPYLKRDGTVDLGTLTCALLLAADETAAPDDHTMRLAGEYPHGTDGQPLAQLINSAEAQVIAGIETTYYLSRKLYGGVQYPDYYVKVTTYVAMLEGPAQEIDPAATAKTFPVIEDDDPDSV